MRMVNIFFLVVFCFFTKAEAQETYTIKPGENILEIVQMLLVIPRLDLIQILVLHYTCLLEK